MDSFPPLPFNRLLNQILVHLKPGCPLSPNAFPCTSATLSGISVFTNNVSAVGYYGSTSLIPVYDDDDASASVLIIDPSISIGASPTIGYAKLNDSLTFTFNVSNNGDVALENVEVDASGLGCGTLNVGNLAISGSASPTCNIASVTGDIALTDITVSGEYNSAHNNVTRDDTVSVQLDMLDPEITIEHTAVSPIIASGDTALFEFTLENTGDVEPTE